MTKNSKSCLMWLRTLNKSSLIWLRKHYKSCHIWLRTLNKTCLTWLRTLYKNITSFSRTFFTLRSDFLEAMRSLIHWIWIIITRSEELKLEAQNIQNMNKYILNSLYIFNKKWIIYSTWKMNATEVYERLMLGNRRTLKFDRVLMKQR